MSGDAPKAVQQYAKEVAEFALAFPHWSDASGARKRLACLLDGEVNRSFVRLVPVARRRSAGTFFTPPPLAQALVDEFRGGPGQRVVDPACGAGDLLLECARRFPVRTSLSQTVREWGGRLGGIDVDPSLVRLAKARLLLLAASRSSVLDAPPQSIEEVFPHVRLGDFLQDPNVVTDAADIVLNPPYCDMAADSGCTWASGSVSAAAVFALRCISQAPPGARIAAILPEVLRCGSLYGRWRAIVESRSELLRATPAGQFRPGVDVHVFRLLVVTGDGSRRQHDWGLPVPAIATVGSLFDISVGPVVPHRHEEAGPAVSFLTTRSVPPRTTLRRSTVFRRFDGRTFTAPFVVVRRTSRPGPARAVASLVLAPGRHAVENHLLVLRPKIPGVRPDCDDLIRVLHSREADEWLDRRISCRHLTVASLAELPWPARAESLGE